MQRARAALLWEAVWPPLAAAGTVLLGFAAVSWFGFWDQVPPYGRIAGVVLFGLALFYVLYPLMRLSAPDRASALTRIDRASGHTHRPATALGDPLANQPDDPVTRALWAAHRARALTAARNLRAGFATPGLAQRDPRALRFLAMLAALVAFIAAGSERGPRLLSAFDWRTPAVGSAPPRLDAWVTPPAYTGRAPIFLTAARQEDGERAAMPETGRIHSVPAGSVLVIRTGGGRTEISAPNARALDPDDKVPGVTKAPSGASDNPGAGIAEQRFALDQDTEVTVTRPVGEPLVWHFSAIPDEPPSIAFRTEPRTNENGALTVEYSASDDYGIVAANAEIALAPSRALRGKETKPPRPLYGAPDVKLALPQGRGGDAATAIDVVDHPWAGARVLMTLVARDEPDQSARSETLETVLPARPFTHPVARALVEQRRRLALDAEQRNGVLSILDALTLYPERFTPSNGVYLGLRSAYWRLAGAKSDDDLRDVVDYLWEIATQLEDGDLPGMQNDLKAAEKALRDALDRNASDEEIKKLMDDLRAALDRYLQEMARQMQQNPDRQTGQLPPGAKLLTPQDLEKMLDRMEDLARGGNREAAKDLLSELSELMNNLQRSQQAQGQMDEGSEAAARALDELGKMIREQSQLRDETFRQRQQGQRGQEGQGQQGQQGQRGPQQGRGQMGQQGDQQGEPGGDPSQQAGGREGQGMDGLGQRQGALRQRLEQLLKDLQAQGLEGNDALGDAGREMGSAEGQLGEGDAGRAFGSQGRALDALRQGAQSMAEQMQQGQPGQAGNQGQPNGGRRQGQQATQDDTDPLGRPTRSRRYDPGSTVRVPGEIDAQRARRVQEELRRRVSEPTRPQDELDYLERLLRD